MSSKQPHDSTANRIAKKLNAEYNRGKGPDVITSGMVVEVETPKSVDEGLSQLQGFKKPVYIAGSSQTAVKKALERTQGTTVGVMDSNGNIIRKSTRKRGGS
jgi:hypothetical protein